MMTCSRKIRAGFPRVLLLILVVILVGLPGDAKGSSHGPGNSEEETSAASPLPWYERLETEWGGQLKIQGSLSWPGSGSLFEPVGTCPNLDGNTQFRLKNILFFSERAYFVTHYELVLSGGDTRRKSETLKDLIPGFPGGDLLLNQTLEDDTRFFDFTSIIHARDGYIVYHRLDRFFLDLSPNWGTVRVGRQAITWGNGLIFNPMDLFNPFPPTDIERDYKVGDDMVLTQFSFGRVGDFQALYVPRREAETGDVLWSQSSLAAKLHVPWNTTEFDLMAAKHFSDGVVGIGSTGYLGNAAWRMDGTVTVLDDTRGKGEYLSLVANADYSWVLGEKNYYGFLEFYYNGLGVTTYGDALFDPNIVPRLRRGELFVLGRFFLTGHVTVELHPLFNLSFTSINNVEDPSGILQVYAIWDAVENVEATFGGNVFYGSRDTEFGGFEIPGTPFLTTPADSVFIWLTYFF